MYINIKSNKFSTHKNYVISNLEMKKRYLKLIAGLMCFKNVQPISHY